MSNHQTDFWKDAEIIDSYTADDAIEDGYLTDVGAIAKEAGFKIPVRITSGVFETVKPSKKAQEYGQDYEGRLWDLLYMCRLAVSKAGEDWFTSFSVLFQNGPGNRNRKTVKFFAAIDQTSGPAIHIMLPEEY